MTRREFEEDYLGTTGFATTGLAVRISCGRVCLVSDAYVFEGMMAEFGLHERTSLILVLGGWVLFSLGRGLRGADLSMKLPWLQTFSK